MHRAWHYACSGQFAQAISDYSRAIELDPANHWPWYHRACLLAQVGDHERYEAHCRAMLDRFGKSRERPIADRTAKACLLMLTSDSDLQVATELVDSALAGGEHSYLSWFQMDKGIAEFRAGRNKSALEWLEKARGAVGVSPAVVTIDMFLAMAHYRLGDAKQAIAVMKRGRELADRSILRIGIDDLSRDGLENNLICYVAIREAEAFFADLAWNAGPWSSVQPAGE